MSVEPVVSIANGRVRGIATAHGRAFLGVPYGRAERFAPPQPAAWTGELRACRPGPVAPQPSRPLGLFTHGRLPETGEQCLSLNVWTPPTAPEGLPVIVWLHGGGFALGWGSASLYDGARLAAAAGIVVVTLNYRLGSLGWLHHPELAASPGAPAGNWGLLDQIAALRWVRDNIAAFGGDPSCVTLAGQSAGALSAMDLLVSPLSAGLFGRAIVQSPPVFDAAHPAELGRRWAEALSRRAGGRRDVFDVEALRAPAAQRIVELHETLLGDPEFAGTRGGALPIVDGVSLPRSPEQAPAARPEIDVLVGTTADEGTFFFRAAGRRVEPDEEGLVRIVGHLPGIDDAARVVADEHDRAAAAGGPVDTNTLLVRIATDAMVVAPTARWAAQRAAGGGRVHRYRVDHEAPGGELGAVHTVDVPLAFGTYADGGAGTRLAGDGERSAAVSRAMTFAWGAFVRDGNPGWAPVGDDGVTEEIAVFGGEGAPVRVDRGAALPTPAL